MNGSSKVAQKLTALFLLTAAILVPCELMADRFVTAAPTAEKVSAAGVLVGKPAPKFSLTDTTGKKWNSEDLKGKIVVLEWFNHGCPFVKKHYDSGNMQKLQKEYTAKGVTWLSINSSAKGKQGNATNAEHDKAVKEKNAAPTALLVDEDGTVGNAYFAKTTPDMYVINKKGIVVYAGAIDDKNGTEQSEIASAKNYVKAALDELLAGKTVTVAETKPYGCSVKYQ
jgi:peroxiredoxin